MHTILLNTNNTTSCTIHIGIDALPQIGSLFSLDQYSHIFVVTDEHVASLLLNKLEALLPAKATSFVIPSGEQHKHINTLENIWTAMHEAGCDRKSLVVNLGGGVITDLGGFAAATYMRGIDFINIPTTLLAQVDASVGGKNGIDFAGIKNLVGSFSQPVGVIIDPTTLKTLPSREFIAGFGEIIKHGLVWNSDYFQLVTRKPPLDYSQTELSDIITGSCEIKHEIIKNDINEQASRKIVNFGHTVGHAVESLSLDSSRPLLHGEAISIGMLAETRLSHEIGLLTESDVAVIKTALLQAGLPIAVPNPDIPKLIKIMQSDKKNENQEIHFTLLDRIGHAQINQKVPESLLRAVLQNSGAQQA